MRSLLSLGSWAIASAIVGLAAVGPLYPAAAHESAEQERLPIIDRAPDFQLTNQDGAPTSLRGLRGKVVVVTFIFTSCKDTCPLLTAKMASLQGRLGSEFGSRVQFVSISVDPERDTPEVLKRYAQGYGADLAGWAFLTGSASQIADVARRYAVFHRKVADGDVDHTFLTSIVDGTGTLRVQYLGVRFDPDEFLHDIQSLLKEGRT